MNQRHLYMRKGIMLLLLSLFGGAPCILAQSAALTYQSRLLDAGQPANGNYDFELSIAEALTNGSYAGSILSMPAVLVVNGIFTVTLDFGDSVFDGSPRWPEVAVRTNDSPASFTVLAPRQPITASPYSVFAETAATAGTADGLVGRVASLTNVNGAPIQPGTIMANQISADLDAVYRA